MNINEHIKINQHKDLLYRQKYATYQLINRTFSTQNTQISARSLAISYICFQVRIVKIKKGGKGAINYYGKSGDSRTPDKGSIREITLPITPDDHLEGPYLLKTRELPGAPPLGPRQGLCPCTPPGALRRAPGGPLDPTRMRRTVRYAHGFFRPPWPFFANPGSATVHIPPLLVQIACPQRRRSWGSWEQSPPPPQWKYGGGAKHIVLPPPPPLISSTWKIDNIM